MVLATSFFASLLLLATAKLMVPRTMVVHESRAAPPQGFVQSGAAPAEQQLTLRIALKQNNIAGLETELYKVSDPASEFYGQHLTLEEVTEFVKPTDETLAVVSSWLSENNIDAKPVTPAGDMLEIKIPVSQADNLLSAEFSVFTHTKTGKTIIRTLQYSLPAPLTQHVEFFHPTTIFAPPLDAIPKFVPASSAKRATPGSDDLPGSCTSTMTPACLQELYGIPTTSATQKSNRLGVAGFLDQFANQEDLTEFLTNFRTDINSSTTFGLETLDGGSNSQNRSQAGVEADLDIQYTVGLATGVPVIFISAGDDNSDDGLDGFLDMIVLLINDPNRPSVLTTSYGFQAETDIPLSVAINLCNTYMQLGALGTSVLFASGDGGVSGGQGEDGCGDYIPAFPATCPFITSVGSTGGINQNPGINEVGSSFSSGGFSNYFAIPDYQAADVAAYIAWLDSLGTIPEDGRYNRSGRGFPDVSAQGENFEIVVDGQFGTVEGTSCSSPTFASVIALLNDELVAAGKPVLGFLNPFLYSSAGQAALNDVMFGDNPGCATDGFFGHEGWDAVTGLGTPNYPALRTAIGL
ncbi:Tripeptidyl-peptidase sed3 [Mycena sanguinolenta]|uniref:tripeptidyl-peptidase II n=1 Tax=Mycena sanguinolenta TaxID=230812 RepID=A0A8H7CG67_9AGAR|nr:Tripeptidyl-peptidase sed3 [Mycena sanguinolenta]